MGDRTDFQSARSLRVFPLLHFSFHLAAWQTGVEGKVTAGEDKTGHWRDTKAAASFTAHSSQL